MGKNARTIARRMMIAEDQTRRLATSQMHRRGTIKVLEEKNHEPPPNDFVPGEPPPGSTLFPNGRTCKEAETRGLVYVKMPPRDQAPLLPAGGHKAGIELNAWQTMEPRE